MRVRIGSPIKGYGQESRNRAARQRIPNRVFTDEDGVEHVEVIHCRIFFAQGEIKKKEQSWGSRREYCRVNIINVLNMLQVNFYIRGPQGAGKVYTEMFKDKAEKEWKYTYLIVEISTPSPAKLMLESYLPA